MVDSQDNLICEISKLLQKCTQNTVTLFDMNVVIPALLKRMLVFLGKQLPVSARNEAVPNNETDTLFSTVAIANGRRLSEKEIADINEKDFDLILNTTTNILKYRQGTEHLLSLLKEVGSRRIEILSYLMQHPQRYISIENIASLPNQSEYISSNTLAKSINILRKALGQTKGNNTYILTERNLEVTHCRYRLNLKWKYLLIKNLKNHG